MTILERIFNYCSGCPIRESRSCNDDCDLHRYLKRKGLKGDGKCKANKSCENLQPAPTMSA